MFSTFFNFDKKRLILIKWIHQQLLPKKKGYINNLCGLKEHVRGLCDIKLIRHVPFEREKIQPNISICNSRFFFLILVFHCHGNEWLMVSKH